MIEYMYHNEGWDLDHPRLILSITGGFKNFTLSHKMKRAFKEGLIKAAASTGAWIITGGIHGGVMKLVGEAVAEERLKYNAQINLLGIATWVSFLEIIVINLCLYELKKKF